MNIVMVLMFILSISEFILNNQQFVEINENYLLIRNSYERIAEIQRIAYNIRTLITINEQKFTNYKDYTTAPDFVEYI